MMRVLNRLIAVTVILSFLAACQTAGNNRLALTQRPTVGSKIILMPLDVELSEMAAGGLLEPKADWTDNAKAHMLAAFEKDAAKRGVSYVKLSDPAEGTPEADLFLQLEALHGIVGQSILIHEYLPVAKLPNKEGKFDWSLGPSAAKLAEAYSSDYALFVFVRDSYTSAGRAAVIFMAAVLFGAAVQGGTQVGFASLVDLKTGEVVWFNRLARGAGDLRTEAPAEETVKVLLEGFPK